MRSYSKYPLAYQRNEFIKSQMQNMVLNQLKGIPVRAPSVGIPWDFLMAGRKGREGRPLCGGTGLGGRGRREGRKEVRKAACCLNKTCDRRSEKRLPSPRRLPSSSPPGKQVTRSCKTERALLLPSKTQLCALKGATIPLLGSLCRRHANGHLASA